MISYYANKIKNNFHSAIVHFLKKKNVYYSSISKFTITLYIFMKQFQTHTQMVMIQNMLYTQSLKHTKNISYCTHTTLAPKKCTHASNDLTFTALHESDMTDYHLTINCLIFTNAYLRSPMLLSIRLSSSWLKIERSSRALVRCSRVERQETCTTALKQLSMPISSRISRRLEVPTISSFRP